MRVGHIFWVIEHRYDGTYYTGEAWTREIEDAKSYYTEEQAVDGMNFFGVGYQAKATQHIMFEDER